MLSWVAIGIVATTSLAAGQENDTPRAAWVEANRAYRAGAFDDAAARFEELLTASPDPRLEANLAAALWRGGDRGSAVVHYRRALELAPRDRSIRSDYERLRAELGNPPDATRGVERALGWIRVDEAVLVLLMASVAGAVSVAATRRRARARGWVVASLLVVGGVAAVRAWETDGSLAAALIDAEIRSSITGEAIAVLREGSVVEVLEIREARARVRTPGVPAGWVATSAIAHLH